VRPVTTHIVGQAAVLAVPAIVFRMIVTVPIVFRVMVISPAIFPTAVISMLVIKVTIVNVAIVNSSFINVTIIAAVCMIEAMIAIIVTFATVAAVFHASFPEFTGSSGSRNGGPSVVRGSKKLTVAPGLALVIPLLV
jgi:hypothetical protein